MVREKEKWEKKVLYSIASGGTSRITFITFTYIYIKKVNETKLKDLRKTIKHGQSV